MRYETVLKSVNTLCMLVSCSVSFVTIYKHLENYRKVNDQRLIVRILVMVPLFSLSAWLSLYCPYKTFVEGFVYLREVYEAFVIYTFYSLLTTLLGGEREIIFSTTGRAPLVVHIPCTTLSKRVDISDPPTFLLIKRLVMQFVWIRPVVSPLQALSPGWLQFPIFIAYNISITLALNALMLFWACLKPDLEPYRVVTKFLSVKLIVFFSYWQTIALSILGYFGIVSNPATLHLTKNTLMCMETIGFAVLHWIAFPYTDYASTVVFGFGRMRMSYAFKDAFGCKDLIRDFESTFFDPKYGYREFDSVEAVMDHPDSSSRAKRLAAGLRYRNGGRSKYWLPKTSLTKMLAKASPSRVNDSQYGSVSQTPDVSQYSIPELPQSFVDHQPWIESDDNNNDAEATISTPSHMDAPVLNMEDEYSDGEDVMYEQARRVYGDPNYPVITVRPSEKYVSFQDRLRREQVLNNL